MAKRLGLSVSCAANVQYLHSHVRGSFPLPLRASKAQHAGRFHTRSTISTVDGLKLPAIKPGVSVSCWEYLLGDCDCAEIDPPQLEFYWKQIHGVDTQILGIRLQKHVKDGNHWDLGVTRWEEREEAKQGFMRANVNETEFSHVEKAWDHWKKIGAPKFRVAPTMDPSELPFRMQCRKYGRVYADVPFSPLGIPSGHQAN